jgi:hypothetical protein
MKRHSAISTCAGSPGISQVTAREREDGSREVNDPVGDAPVAGGVSFLENVPSPSRGRPPAFHDDLMMQAKLAFNVKSSRAAQNKIYMSRACQVLGYSPRLAWLGLSSKKKRLAGGRIRECVLAELGRIHDEKCLAVVARELCEKPPATTRLGIQVVRQLRCNGRWIGGAEDLANRIWALVKAYRSDHPNTSWRETRLAVQVVAAQMPLSRSEEAGIDD